jgi:hypothetical protein
MFIDSSNNLNKYDSTVYTWTYISSDSFSTLYIWNIGHKVAICCNFWTYTSLPCHQQMFYNNANSDLNKGVTIDI